MLGVTVGVALTETLGVTVGVLETLTDGVTLDPGV